MPRGRGLEATYEREKGAMRAGVAGGNVRERGAYNIGFLNIIQHKPSS